MSNSGVIKLQFDQFSIEAIHGSAIGNEPICALSIYEAKVSRDIHNVEYIPKKLVARVTLTRQQLAKLLLGRGKQTTCVCSLDEVNGEQYEQDSDIHNHILEPLLEEESNTKALLQQEDNFKSDIDNLITQVQKLKVGQQVINKLTSQLETLKLDFGHKVKQEAEDTFEIISEYIKKAKQQIAKQQSYHIDNIKKEDR